MNIFEFLGLEEFHRPADKVVQLVKHWDEVNKDGKLHKKVSFPLYAQCKKDGNFSATVIYNGFCGIFNRRGSHFTNVEMLEVKYNGLADGVYLGELCASADYSLEELSGVVNPNRVKALYPEQYNLKKTLNIFFFDYLTIDEFIKGSTKTTFLDRFNSLVYNIKSTNFDFLGLEKVIDEEELDRFADKMIAAGQEGAVFKQDVGYLAGAKDWHQMKKVRSVDYDLLCIGIEEGKGKYAGKVANLIFKYKGDRTVKAMLGKGWTHEDAEKMFNDYTYGHDVGMKEYSHVDSPVGRIFKVYALQESSKGVLRLPKVGELRHDKTKPDF